MEEKILYRSQEVLKNIYDLQVAEYDGEYEIFIESNIAHKSEDNLKSYNISLLNGCKIFMENKYKFINTSKSSDENYLVYEIEYKKNAKLYLIDFKKEEFKDLESVYNWICKAIKQLSN